MKAGKYGAMGAFYLIVIAAVTACVFFIVYSAQAHGSKREGDTYLDPYEHDFGRMSISAYATIIALLSAILILMFYMTYLAHTHLKH